MNRQSVTLLLALLAAVSTAGIAATRDEQTKACKGDAVRYCAADIPDEDKIKACMEQHFDELSPRCKAVFKQPKHK